MSERVQTWIDGRPADSLPLPDRGLDYGDGLFETCAVVDGRVELLEAHLDRLARGCERLGLPMPERALLAAEMRALASGWATAVLRLQLTRGTGGRGYAPPEAVRVRRLLTLSPWPEGLLRFDGQGARLRTCTLRLGHQPLLAGIKHLNRLEQVLAAREVQAMGCDEGLLLDTEGHVIEGTRSNLFLIGDDGTLVTPELSRCGVAGVMRGALMGCCAAAGIPCTVRPVTIEALQGAAGLLLTNSLIGLRPVAELDGRPLPVSPLADRLRERLHAWLVGTEKRP
ncbi:aminodeoxychorismate lyase [Thiohalobacter sp.]|uniref:aminodeoxychorismate lyase n=1 Tax=Thiohalobacter sp. TaxID=2025948 RepID=UPI00260315CD|nr:aminodeoxychorismate lyase [Thiohalobacter sp.]